MKSDSPPKGEHILWAVHAENWASAGERDLPPKESPAEAGLSVWGWPAPRLAMSRAGTDTCLPIEGGLGHGCRRLRYAFPLLKQLELQLVCDTIRRRAHCHVATSVQKRCPKLHIFLGPFIATARARRLPACNRSISRSLRPARGAGYSWLAPPAVPLEEVGDRMFALRGPGLGNRRERGDPAVVVCEPVQQSNVEHDLGDQSIEVNSRRA